jgi:hypothetical protein
MLININYYIPKVTRKSPEMITNTQAAKRDTKTGINPNKTQKRN